MATEVGGTRAWTRGRALGFVGLFLYLLAGGLFVPSSSMVYRAASGAIILVLALRLFRTHDIVGYAKLALAVAFTASQQVGFFFIVVTAVLYRERLLFQRSRELRPIYLLVVYGLLSSLINQWVELNLLAFPFFVASFFLPTIFFALFHQDEVAQGRSEVIEFFFLLLTAAALVIVIQAIAYWRESPDYRTGGTWHAHMAGILFSVGFVLALTRWLAGPTARGRMSGPERLVLMTGLPLLFLVDAKYVFGVLMVSLVTVGTAWVVLRRSRLIPAMVAAALLLAVVTSWGAIKRTRIALSLADLGEGTATIESLFDGLWLTPRGEILEATLALPQKEPRIFLVGSGPGSFLSRAANSRAYDTMQKSEYDLVGGQREVQSKLPSFVPAFTGWVTKKYALDVVHWSTFEEVSWQSGLVRWVSSLTSFLWEFGLIGFSILLFFYLRLLARGLRRGAAADSDSFYGYSLGMLVPFFLGVAYFDLWLEIPQFAVLHWSLLGLCSFAPQESDIALPRVEVAQQA